MYDVDNTETIEQLRAKIAELESKKAAAISKTSLRFQVSDKGAVSVYNLQRFPVTLYGDQWMRLIGCIDELQQFIAENQADISTKPKPLSREEKNLAKVLDNLESYDSSQLSPALAARMATLKEKLGR